MKKLYIIYKFISTIQIEKSIYLYEQVLKYTFKILYLYVNIIWKKNLFIKYIIKRNKNIYSYLFIWKIYFLSRQRPNDEDGLRWFTSGNQRSAVPSFVRRTTKRGTYKLEYNRLGVRRIVSRFAGAPSGRQTSIKTAWIKY